MIHVEEATAAERWRSRRDVAMQGLHKLVEGAGRALEGSTLLCLGLLTLLYVPWGLVEAHAHLLLNDEIYTVHIAQQATWRQMLWLAREIDLHPPMHYVLQREALLLGLPRWLGSRLPSLVAGWLMSVALFRLGSRRLGNVMGMVTVLFVWVSPAIDWAWDNRPYMLWMCGLSLLMLAWDRAISPFRTWRSVAAVFGAGLLMTSSHLIGVACLLPFALAEGTRFWRERQTDWWLWLALLSPASIGAGYFYQIRHLRENSFPVLHLPSLGMGEDVYRAMVTQFFFLLSMSTVIWCYLGWRREEGSGRRRRLRMRPEEAVFLAAMIVLPALLMVVGSVLKVQFWARYGSCGVLALGVVIPWMIQGRVGPFRAFGTLLVGVMLGNVVYRMATEFPVQGTDAPGYHQMGRQPILLSGLDARLPIVDASPMIFTEMSDREPPAIASRVFYLTDRAAAVRYSGYTLFENEDKIRRLMNLPSQTAPLGQFLRTHRQFYLVANYDSEQDWLPRKLVDSGVELRYLGKFVSSYDYDDLYLVTVPAAVQ